MINFDFLPSRQLSFYMARLFITRSLAVLVALVLVLMTTGAVYLVGSTGGGETGDPGDAAAIPLAVGAATCAFLELLWAVVCCVGLSRDRRSL